MNKRRKGILTKIALAILALYVAVTLLSLQLRINAVKTANEELEKAIAQQELQNARLSDALGSELDDADIIRIAHDELGLVLPTERVFINISN